MNMLYDPVHILTIYLHFIEIQEESLSFLYKQTKWTLYSSIYHN